MKSSSRHIHRKQMLTGNEKFTCQITTSNTDENSMEC